MGNLFVVGFEEPNQAEEVRLKLQKLEGEGLLDLADVVVAVKDEAGKARLHRPVTYWPKERPSKVLWAASQPDFSECHGRCYFWCTRRHGNYRSLHEEIGHSADP